MSRRKHLVYREPSGKVQRQPQLPSPLEITRLRDAALSGLREPVWGSILGLLYLKGKISASQFAAGKRWASLVEDYSAACQSPRRPRSVLLDSGIGQQTDPDSSPGRKEARRHVLTVEGYLDGMGLLKRMGESPRRAMVDVCELNRMPSGIADLVALRMGLQAFVVFWAEKRK